MPTEWPAQRVTPEPTRKTNIASVVAVIGPPTIAIAVMIVSQLDFAGAHTT